MTTRLEKFESFSDHVVHGKLYKKLSAIDRETCRIFLRKAEALNADEFTLLVNRWMLDQPKPKNYSTMWALVSQSV